MVSVGGRFGEKQPGDAEDFLDFARQLRTPPPYNVMRHAAPVSAVARFAFPASIWRHFERLQAFPQGYCRLATRSAASTRYQGRA
ncbi:MAG: hypothetical protein JO122_09855 [Acetobacteraceae bacterium]|nr:hypothetical protein [Acetobacteraceae bacterium]